MRFGLPGTVFPALDRSKKLKPTFPHTSEVRFGLPGKVLAAVDRTTKLKQTHISTHS